VAIVLAELGPEEGEPDLVEGAPPRAADEPLGGRDLLEPLPVAETRGIDDGGGEAELAGEAEHREAQVLED
jgi:hypothetical protein